MEEYQLKACPFCRDSELLVVAETDCGDNVREWAVVVSCGNCGAKGPWADDFPEAVKMWNC